MTQTHPKLAKKHFVRWRGISKRLQEQREHAHKTYAAHDAMMAERIQRIKQQRAEIVK
jgi:hypothetical protein